MFVLQRHAETVRAIRTAAAQRPGAYIAIMLDTKGPEIRTGLLKGHKPVELKEGQDLEISTDYAAEGDSSMITCSYKALPTSVKPGMQILAADGTLVMRVKECRETSVVVTVCSDVTIGEKKNMNLPGALHATKGYLQQRRNTNEGGLGLQWSRAGVSHSSQQPAPARSSQLKAAKPTLDLGQPGAHSWRQPPLPLLLDVIFGTFLVAAAGVIVDLPTITEKDRDDLLNFGLKYGVDMIAASFVRKASDVEVRAFAVL